MFLSEIAAPTHTYTFSRNPYAFQGPVHSIHVRYVETYYDGVNIHRIHDKRVHTINITDTQVSRTPYRLTEGEKIFKTLDVGSYSIKKITTLPEIAKKIIRKILGVSR